MFFFVGFIMLFKILTAEACSANQQSSVSLSGTNGTIPSKPGRLPANAVCQWTITAPVGKVLRIDIVVIFLTRPCVGEYLRIHDGPNETSVRLVEYSCINELDTYLYSSGRSLWVEVKTGAVANSTILDLPYDVRDKQECSKNSTVDASEFPRENNFSSPYYPDGFPINMTCGWYITAPENRTIKLQVTSRFSSKDSLEVYDVDGSVLTPIALPIDSKYGPKEIYSKFRSVYMVFKTDDKMNDFSEHGIFVKYSAVRTVSSGTCVPTQNSIIQMAGEDGRSFSTPQFPLFPGKGTCRWNITVPSGEFVKLTFVKNFGRCTENYVQVFDVTNFNRIHLGKFCKKSKGQVVYSKGNNLLVEYSSLSEGSLHKNGFLAKYESRKVVPAPYSCYKTKDGVTSFKLNNTHGELASCDYPLLYPNNVRCFWEIKIPDGYIIQLTFHSFALQQSNDCKADFVEVSHGEYSWVADVIGKFCGSSLPPVIQLNHSNAYVYFKADSSESHTGFHASYKLLRNAAMGPCRNPGQNNLIPMTGETGKLSSPLYPVDLTFSIMCTWVITVPEGHFVRLNIKSLQLGSFCLSGSTLDVRDGQSSSSDLLRSFCGRKHDNRVLSSGRHLWVRLDNRGDNSPGETGFYATFETVNQLPAPFSCTHNNRINKLVSAESGSLASLNYPLPYDENIECVWAIYVDTDYNVKLSFDFFNLSHSDDCSEDYVEVRDGMFDTSDLLGKFCGSEKPKSITSDSWDLRVTFKSSGKMKYPGFKASYERKKTVAAIMKIVGICIGAASALFAVIGGCYKCCKIHDQANAVIKEIEGDEAQVPLQEQATQL